MQNIKNKILEIAPLIHEAIKNGDGKNAKTIENSSGDSQVGLDVVSDEIISSIFQGEENIYALISEEKEIHELISEKGEYIIAYDPLDGSSVVDVNFTVGSIFGIYKRSKGNIVGNACLHSLQGKNLVAGCYIIYGPKLEIIWANDLGVTSLIDTGKKYKLKDSGNILTSASNPLLWSISHGNIMNHFWGKEYSIRYSGAMVSDLHQIIIKGGGIFSYPSTQKYPNGKLRKTFEVFPFAYIFEKLGGSAINSQGKRILDQPILTIHERSSCYIGSKEEIDIVRTFIENV